MKGLFSGRQIKDLKGRSQKITRSQTASSAYAAIMGKYGSIQDNAHYYHLGKGNWHKYSLENDRKRTGKLAESKAIWAERPNKFDWAGIDTRAEGKPATASVKNKRAELEDFIQKSNRQIENLRSSRAPLQAKKDTKRKDAIVQQEASLMFKVGKAQTQLAQLKNNTKRSFSVSSLKASAPVGRKGKAAQKLVGKPVTKHISVSKPPKLSLSSMKAPSKPSGRKTPRTIKAPELGNTEINTLQRPHRVIKHGVNLQKGVTWSGTNGTFKIVDIKTVAGQKQYGVTNVNKQGKVYYSNERDLQFDIRLALKSFENKKEMEKKHEVAKAEEDREKKVKEVEYNKLIEGLEGFESKYSAMQKPRVIETLNKYVRDEGKIKTRKEYVRDSLKDGYRVTFTKWHDEGRKINGERKGKDHSGKVLMKGSSFMSDLNKTEIDFAEYLTKKWGVSTPKLSPSMIKAPSKLSSRTNKVAPRGSQKVVTKAIAVQGKYRYASFMRPLGTWFTPGTPFRIETVTASDRDFRYNRSPHSVISTGSRLSEETLKKFELVDLAEGKKLQELIKYARSFDFLNDSMKGQLEDLILKGKSKAEIDKYIEKGRQMAEKKTQKPSSSSSSAVTDKDILDKALTAKSGYTSFVAELTDGDKIQNSCKNTKEFIKELDKFFHALDKVKRIGVVVGHNPERIVYYPSMPYTHVERKLTPLKAFDKAKALEKKAEQMQKELHSAMENIPAGQGYHNVTDRNRLDKYRAKQSKILELHREAEQLRKQAWLN